MNWAERASQKKENTEMKINFGGNKFKWVHPDEYAENRYAYAQAEGSFIGDAPVTLKVAEEESVLATEEAVETFLEKEVKIGLDESTDDIFKGLNVAEIRALCKTKYNYRLPMTIQKRESAMRNVKKYLEE